MRARKRELVNCQIGIFFSAAIVLLNMRFLHRLMFGQDALNNRVRDMSDSESVSFFKNTVHLLAVTEIGGER